jgi:hypothetical protein
MIDEPVLLRRIGNISHCICEISFVWANSYVVFVFRLGDHG